MAKALHSPHRPPLRKKGKPHDGGGYLHLVLAFVAVVVVVTLSVVAVRHYRKLAYRLAAEHALNDFVAAQQRYFLENGRYAGSQGDFVEGGNPPTSAFPHDFEVTPSEGVRIVIISGNGAQPTQAPSFKAKATHDRSATEFVYDFATRTMEESEAQP